MGPRVADPTFHAGPEDFRKFLVDPLGLTRLNLLQNHSRMAAAVIPYGLTLIGKAVARMHNPGPGATGMN